MRQRLRPAHRSVVAVTVCPVSVHLFVDGRYLHRNCTLCGRQQRKLSKMGVAHRTGTEVSESFNLPVVSAGADSSPCSCASCKECKQRKPLSSSHPCCRQECRCLQAHPARSSVVWVVEALRKLTTVVAVQQQSLMCSSSKFMGRKTSRQELCHCLRYWKVRW